LKQKPKIGFFSVILPFSDLFLFLILAIVSYVLLIKQLGFYWDDWVFVWIARTLGSAWLPNIFPASRFLWTRFLEFNTTLLGTLPWVWHLFSIVWRLAATVSFWWLLRLLWPDRKTLATMAGCLFLLFPAFQMQFVSVNTGHFFIFVTAFLLSLCLNLFAVKNPKRYWVFISAALCLSLVNLLAWEYLFTLELIRPVLLWQILAVPYPEKKMHFRRTIWTWLPFFILQVLVLVWRIVLAVSQSTSYPLVLLQVFQRGFGHGIVSFLSSLSSDLFTSTLAGWAQAFRLPNITWTEPIYFFIFCFLVILSGLVLFVYLAKKYAAREGDPAASGWIKIQPIMLGLIALLLAGGPLWLTGLPVRLNFPNNRLMIPFMLGSSLLLAGAIDLFAALPRAWNWLAPSLGALVIAFSAGAQFRYSLNYQQDWILQRALYWQLSWRIPGLEKNTLLLSNDLPSKYISDNSVTAPINWMYAPDYHGGDLPFLLYYPSVRLDNRLPSLEPGIAIDQEYEGIPFHGNTSQVVAFYFSGTGCLRVLDRNVDPYNLLVPKQMRQASLISNPAPILSGDSPSLDLRIFGEEPVHDWCYYFQKADLARQVSDWDDIARIGSLAFSLDDPPRDPAEVFPFIEGYAHLNDWSTALRLTAWSIDHNIFIQPATCALWFRINTLTDSSSEKDAALEVMRTKLGCNVP
jgi:hypothetical protein